MENLQNQLRIFLESRLSTQEQKSAVLTLAKLVVSGRKSFFSVQNIQAKAGKGVPPEEIKEALRHGELAGFVIRRKRRIQDVYRIDEKYARPLLEIAHEYYSQ